MRYGEDDRESDNVEDRRGQRGPMFPFPGSGGGRTVQIPLTGGSIGTLIVIGLILWAVGINPLELLSEGNFPQVQLPQSEQQERPGPVARRSPTDIPGLPGGTAVNTEDDMKRFVSQVLADTEDVWTREFASLGKKYVDPQMVLFTDATRTACGVGVAAMGPFYCPLDHKVYIDLAFYEQLKRRFDAPGDFARAYVIAHEVGHHVQKLFGIADKVQELQGQLRPGHANALSVRMELQADCFAGVWANLNDQLKKRLQPGDVEAGSTRRARSATT